MANNYVKHTLDVSKLPDNTTCYNLTSPAGNSAPSTKRITVPVHGKIAVVLPPWCSTDVAPSKWHFSERLFDQLADDRNKLAAAHSVRAAGLAPML